MSFNQKQHLENNIEAIRLAFELEKSGTRPTPEQQFKLRKYCGFGGLKCILLPCNTPEDIAQWNKTDAPLFPLVMQLHQVLKDAADSELQYKMYMDSLQSSILTAFYTPPEIASVIAYQFAKTGIQFKRFLDPSAGTGVFLSVSKLFDAQEKVCFEKDLMTGKILSLLFPDDTVYVDGFETMNSRYNGYFDVVSSNIPFGDFRVFDSSFSDSKDEVKRRSASRIHCYFFFKAMDALREGGIMAFITSRWLTDGKNSEEERKWLMQRSNLVSAVRLPDNLFTDFANTQAPTDLIILQKNTAKKDFTNLEEAFINTVEICEGYPINKYFIESEQNILHTRRIFGTDQYGKPAIEYFHDGAMQEIAAALSAILEKDLKQYLDMMPSTRTPIG